MTDAPDKEYKDMFFHDNQVVTPHDLDRGYRSDGSLDGITPAWAQRAVRRQRFWDRVDQILWWAVLTVTVLGCVWVPIHVYLAWKGLL